MTSIAISRLHFPVTTLGPGRRIGVWFQGCSIGCKGCISVDTWPSGIGVTTVTDVVAKMSSWAGKADGLTVSGGEPFDQPDALRAVLEGWRALSNGDVLVFSGYEYAVVRPLVDQWPDLIDGLIAGPYDQTQAQTRALRGSDNQTLHRLTPRGDRFARYERPLNDDDRKLDVMFDADGGVWFAGIPARDDFRRLQRNLRREGHAVQLLDQAKTSPR